jgi:hypothetical protein
MDNNFYKILETFKRLDESVAAEDKLDNAETTDGVGTHPDRLQARTGMNMAHKFPRPGQTDFKNIPGTNLPSGISPETKKHGEKWRADRPANLKAAIKHTLGKHGHSALPENDDWDDGNWNDMPDTHATVSAKQPARYPEAVLRAIQQNPSMRADIIADYERKQQNGVAESVKEEIATEWKAFLAELGAPGVASATGSTAGSVATPAAPGAKPTTPNPAEVAKKKADIKGALSKTGINASQAADELTDPKDDSGLDAVFANMLTNPATKTQAQELLNKSQQQKPTGT